ncbi:hypothetical protein FKV24_014180 [Lysobacter maris]|uniref:Uncharacterized protein n=1 Tax=Marilutibacter maris TaxID=1605891 RepID=A0A508A7I5_9GAMM|nr:antirestriction protein ArdA [Lysobacter maris]KAB8173387.1 hypothetical protein FKV24_014180 [Lysobacter maris]
MARILVAVQAVGAYGERLSQWIDVDDADAMRRKIAEVLRGLPGVQGWCVLAYDGMPDLGPYPDIGELLAYLDAVDDYGEPFEKLWADRRFDGVLQAADMFADTYQGTYPDAAAWARHYLALTGRLLQICPDFDFDAHGREAAAMGDVRFIAATDGGVHVFWND